MALIKCLHQTATLIHKYQKSSSCTVLMFVILILRESTPEFKLNQKGSRKKNLFLMARPLRGGGEGRAIKEKKLFSTFYFILLLSSKGH